MKYFIKLIRLPNLLIIALTAYLIRFCVIAPLIELHFFQLQMAEIDFFLFVFSIMLLTAGGYVINDYFDTKTDFLNRPNTVIVGKHIERRSAIAIHIVFNVIAIILGFYVAYKVGNISYGIPFLFVSGILWFYSSVYKRQFLLGNIIVSVLGGLLPLAVAIAEIPLLEEKYSAILFRQQFDLKYLYFWILGFSFFAFISTLIREIVKDIEDFEGDEAYGRNTLPIVLGIFYSKLVVIALIVITILSLIYVSVIYLPDYYTISYFSVTIIIPFIVAVFLLFRADNKRDYHIISTLIKIIMLAGILYAPVVWYLIKVAFM